MVKNILLNEPLAGDEHHHTLAGLNKKYIEKEKVISQNKKDYEERFEEVKTSYLN